MFSGKSCLLIMLLLLFELSLFSQVGIGTTIPKSTFEVNGTIGFSALQILGPTVLDGNNSMIIATNPAGTLYPITLPSGNTVRGRVYTIKLRDPAGFGITIKPFTSQKIEGEDSLHLNHVNDFVQLLAVSGGWLIIGGNDKGIRVGDRMFGGIVFYVDHSGKHGLIASLQNQSNEIKWNNSGSDAGYYAAAKLQGINQGMANTNFITVFNVAGNQYAAKLCWDYSFEGLSDWYLPSIDELKLMYLNLKLNNFGTLGTGSYWSSTNFSQENEAAYSINFSNGEVVVSSISALLRVRAIRQF